MEEVVELLEEFFSKNSKSYSKSEIKKQLKLKGETKEKILNAALNVMVEEGILFYDNKGYKIFPKQAGYAFGELQINKSGTGFVHTKDGHTILIENCDLNGSLNGDKVIVSNIYSKRKDYYHGEIYKVTKRKTGNVIFEVIGNGRRASLVPYNNLEFVNVSINPHEFDNLIDGNLILVKVSCDSEDKVYKGTIDKIIGHKDDPNIDIKLILEKHNVSTEFSKDILMEAESLPKCVTDSDIVNRVDLRNENIFTIDCDNTKDRDDSVGIQKLDNGNYLLKVNIAHVSHYIKRDSLLFEEALNRCMSHYPGNTCIPMLPHLISNGICSLNPNVDRLTRTIEMEIDCTGTIVNYDIYNSVINSKIAMSYSNVNKVLDGEIINDYEPYRKELQLLKELNYILERARNERNYINFNTSEIQIIKNSDGETIFRPNNQGLAGQIIENCMMIANNTVYNHYSWNFLQYRVHEAPDEEKVKSVISILRSSGIPIPKISNITSRNLKIIMNSIKDSEISEIISEYLLKSMKRARYDIVNLGHFALQYDTYGHITSPIRRIIDLITNMTIDNIDNFDYSDESIKSFEKFLNEVCERTNEIERKSKLIEEETIDMIAAEEMKKHIGEEFEVYITDISNNSIMVRTKNLIRGKIKLDSEEDDKYYYDPNRNAIIGRSSQNKYQIGNKLLVRVKDASKETRTVYFELTKQKTLKKIS